MLNNSKDKLFALFVCNGMSVFGGMRAVGLLTIEIIS